VVADQNGIVEAEQNTVGAVGHMFAVVVEHNVVVVVEHYVVVVGHREMLGLHTCKGTSIHSINFPVSHYVHMYSP
jgi:hypothetical protein